MANVKLFDQTGKEVSTVELNDAIFGIEPNESVVFDVVISQRASLRQGTHAVKNRSAVSGGGRKPWRQKGTGRARQGSIRSPQWRGGGVVFGPTPRSYGYKLPQKVRRLALKSVYSAKVAEDKFVAVEAAFEGVKVASVNTVTVKPKQKRVGRYTGFTSKTKKAIITLTADSKAIELFAAEAE